MTQRLPSRILALGCACAALFTLVSCATLQRNADEGFVRNVAGLVNAGNATALSSLSEVPFLVDGEIVPLPEDVASFWSTAVKAGFRIDAAALDSGTPVDAESWRAFADTAEVRFWFSRYAKDARVIALTMTGGRHALLVARPSWFSWKLLGFKGPY
jgi:hypothetical protein